MADQPQSGPDAGAFSSDETRRRRLLFRATHRGTHETDLLIGGFVRARLAGLTQAEMDALEEIMELPDADLADWLTGRRAVPAEADSPMLRAMRAAALAEAARRAGRE
jgi:antitoxin CptB